MHLIVTEKQIAGRRIAEILSNGSSVERERFGIPLWEFSLDGEKTTVFPLKGHVMDVDFPKKYKSWFSSTIMQLPKAQVEYYVSLPGIESALRELAPKVKKVTIATDNDREGEAIGLEALEILKKHKASFEVARARFSAMTPKEVRQSFKELTGFDYHLAGSANARREIDLVWGAALTRFVSIIAQRGGKDFLSVGRVQTPTLALVVKNELERRKFVPEKYWVVSALLEAKNAQFLALHEKRKFNDKEEAARAHSASGDTAKLLRVKRSRKIIAKPVPFNTTEFLKSASAVGLGASRAMGIAEYLYMNGFISYPRTDCNVYPASIDLREIMTTLSGSEDFGWEARELLGGKMHASAGNKNTPDHPPIHPVGVASKSKLNPVEWKVYELIVRRFFATLSEDALVALTRYDFDISGEKYYSTGQTTTKPGWKKHYPYSKLNEVELPEMVEGDYAKVVGKNFDEKETQPPANYSQGSLIGEMQKLNLGTKSTRAEIIQKLYNRNYITGAKSITPSGVSIALVESLEKHAPEMTTPDTTAKLEQDMDLIAIGRKTQEEVVNDSRNVLGVVVKGIESNREVISKDLRASINADLALGKCPKCGNGLLGVRRSRLGKRFAGCSSYPECTNTYPLPGFGGIEALGRACEHCNAPVIAVRLKAGKGWEMCLTIDCKSKEGWKKREGEGNEKKETAKSKKRSSKRASKAGA